MPRAGPKETLTATLVAEKAGTLAIEAVAIDGDKVTSTPVSASIAVGAPNQPPVVATVDAPQEVGVGVAFDVQVVATDDHGVASVEINAGGRTQSLAAKGRPQETLTATFTAEKAGTLAVSAAATDADGVSGATVTVEISVLTPFAPQTVAVGSFAFTGIGRPPFEPQTADVGTSSSPASAARRSRPRPSPSAASPSPASAARRSSHRRLMWELRLHRHRPPAVRATDG